MAQTKPLSFYIALNYPFVAHVEEDGEYFVTFPDLPGCLTGAPTLEELPAMIREGSGLWLEGEYEDGHEMPLPTRWNPNDEDYSGKFNVRLPRSLHRALAEAAGRDGVSLNQHVLALLARGEAEKRLTKNADAAEKRRPAHRVAEERESYEVAPARKRRPRTTPAAPKHAQSRGSAKR